MPLAPKNGNIRPRTTMTTSKIPVGTKRKSIEQENRRTQPRTDPPSKSLATSRSMGAASHGKASTATVTRRQMVPKSAITSTKRTAKPPPATGTANARQPNRAASKSSTPATKKRPAWDLRGKISDMEQDRENNQERISELSKDWQQMEDEVADKETEAREKRQRLLEIESMLEAAARTHSEDLGKETAAYDQTRKALDEEDDAHQTKVRAVKQELARVQERTADLVRQSEHTSIENTALRTTLAKILGSEAEVGAMMRPLQAKGQHIDTMLVESQEKIDQLESSCSRVQHRTTDLETKLLDYEKTRRRHHNTVQELKGNIRVFCRVRPILESEKNDHRLAQISFSGSKPEIGDHSEKLEFKEEVYSTLGKTSTKTHPFSFDKVFEPTSTQHECYEEISQLVQSALDGYNVCIFAYGQTGSGKTYTMQGPPRANAESAGMIPRAVQQIYDVAQKLNDRNWSYSMEGQFLEIYNETVHDLLGDTSTYGKLKHEIRHEKTGRTTVTDMTAVVLDSPAKVTSMLKKASQNRATGATNLNERSSRSHSVFMLRITGSNSVTREHCSGVLNLIDLAGSERLAQSGSVGDRLRETQAINKSLSCLGDVIHALANNKDGGHVPYRNSKLTYLLQNSLGGNSKTLMFVNVSPLSEHFGETLCSLRFATKVNSCRIGTATRKVTRPLSSS